jgi:hypothetical protein
MTVQSISSILVILATGTAMPLLVEWLKQPAWAGKVVLGMSANGLVAFASAFVLGILAMLAKDTFVFDHAPSISSLLSDAGAVVGIACANYELWFKNTALKDWLHGIGIFKVVPYTEDPTADVQDI